MSDQRARESAELSDVQVSCPTCGAAVMVEVVTWPDGARDMVCEDACDDGHVLTDEQKRALMQGALAALERDTTD